MRLYGEVGFEESSRYAEPTRDYGMGETPFSAKLPPPKPKNADRRAREYLTFAEVDQLMRAARRVGRHGDRDATLILLLYPTWTARIRNRGPAVEPDRFENRFTARSAAQEWRCVGPSSARSGVACAAASEK